MGRVYNALVRAERWNDRDRPIGSPARNDAEVKHSQVAAVFSFNNDSAADESFEYTDLTFSEENYSQASGDLFGVRSVISVSESNAAQEIARSPVRPLAPVVKPPVFEEPAEVVNVSHLTIDPHLPVFAGDDSLAVERFRTLGVRLLNLAARRKLKTLLITSAEAGEGKTTVATSVAWSLAKHPERRVLLIDACLTSSTVCRSLGINAKRGWIDLIDGSCDPTQAMLRLDPNGLYVLTPGPLAGTVTADACAAGLEDMIAKMASRFDVVVVDSPAILESPETQSLAGMLDGSVIVARAGRTHHSRVTAARKLVPKERRLGVVLNESDIDANRGRGKGSFAGSLFGRRKRRA
jgi:capsular exopolysaccharide synthesis family protein